MTLMQRPAGFLVDQTKEALLVELPALGWLCGDGSAPGLGWTYVYGPDIAPGGPAQERASFAELVLVERLRRAVARLNPELPPDVVQVVIDAVVTNQSPIVLENHREFHRLLIEGVPVFWDDGDGASQTATARLIDFDDPSANEFVVVNQFTIVVGPEGRKKNRRPDLLLFANGIPLAEIECKPPGPDGQDDEGAGVDPAAVEAHNQVAHYVETIPDLYRFVEFVGITDLRRARVGTITTPAEHFAEWKTLSDDPAEKAKRHLQLMLEGAFEPGAFLDIVRNFVAFETDGSRTWKVMAKYHQVHAVNAAVESVAAAMGGDRRGGLVWHTQGSGKSYTMSFFVAKLRRDSRFRNPTIVCVTDRTDLDNQLAEQFERLPQIASAVQQANEITGSDSSLYSLLDRPAGGIVFTTIQKFQPPAGETGMPLLSERENIVVIADEAHRSQYASLAQNLTIALPRAVRVGFTGTPVEKADRSTRLVFGDYISVYRMRQAQEDRATVPIFYESRQIPVAVEDPEQLREVEEILEGEDEVAAAKLVKAWAQLERVVGAEDRVERLVDDLVDHFSARCETLEGKAMVVCFSRRIAADVATRLAWRIGADAATAVISAAATDPPELSTYRRSKQEMRQVAKDFKDPDHPLRVVVVKDMWLTGFDVPALHTLYIDKPMRDHGLLQAIARVNRVFADKPGGMVVDYIGIGDDLRASLKAYDQSDLDDPVVPVATAISRLREKAEVLETMVAPVGFKLGATLAPTERADLFLACHDHVVREEDQTTAFLNEQAALARWYALCRTEPAAIDLRDDVAFFGSLAQSIRQTTVPGAEASPEARQAVKQFFSDGLGAGQVIDMFGLAGEERPEVSVLSDEFLDQIGGSDDKPNLRIRLLEKLLRDEVKARARSSSIQAKEFSEEIADLLKRYELRQIESAEVIKRLVEIAKAMRAARHRHERLGLTVEEAAFYDALAGTAEDLTADPQLAKIASALVKSIRSDLTVDWTDREATTAKIRSKIKHLLRTEKYRPPVSGNSGGGGGAVSIERATDLILQQARQLYRYYPDIEADELGRLFV